MAIARAGLKSLFPKEVNMISGPGCPVCVTPTSDIDKAIDLAGREDVVIATFGDMIRVPGSFSSLEKEKAKGADLRIIYSPMDALELAQSDPGKDVVLLGVGFETTSPGIAAAIMKAKSMNLKNFFVLSMFKTIPEALKAILDIKKRRIDGFLLPGHVSAIIGSKPYQFIAKKYGVPGVIGGFDAKDIMDSIELLLSQIKRKKPEIHIQYSNVVKEDGNLPAKKFLKEVFRQRESNWRGIGVIPKSGLKLKEKYAEFDAEKKFNLKERKSKDPRGCGCGDVLLGLISPKECTLFGKVCTPGNPIGPCMVSSEGACAAEYKYGGRKKYE